MEDGFLPQVNVAFFFIVSQCRTDASFVPQIYVTLFIA
jgi:hypothetical protein